MKYSLTSKTKKPQKLQKYSQNYSGDIKIGPWSQEEDALIKKLVLRYGPQKWSNIAKFLPGRIGKQCRERWHNHLNPCIRKDSWTIEEEWLLFLYHLQIGNRWAEITKILKGRTDNSIKNHWNSAMKKRLQEYHTKYNALISAHFDSSHFCSMPQPEEKTRKRGRKTSGNLNTAIVCTLIHQKLVEQAITSYQGVVVEKDQNDEVDETENVLPFQFTPRSDLKDFFAIDEISHGILSPVIWNVSVFNTPEETPKLIIKKNTPFVPIVQKSLEKSEKSDFVFESPSLMLNLEDTPKFVRPFQY